MGETLDIKNAQSVTAKSSPDSASKIDLEYESGRGRNIHETVSLAFHGNHSENVYLVQDSGNTPSNDGGIVIPQGTAKTIPNLSIDEGPQYLWASSSTSVTVTVIRGELDIASNSSGFIKGDVQVDAVYNSKPRNPSDGDRVDVQSDDRGNIRTAAEPLDQNFTESGLSPDGTWSWRTYRPDWDWLVRSLTLFLQETSGSDNFKFQIYGTNQESPSTPSGSDPDGWYDIHNGITTVAASGEDVVFHTGKNTKQIAIGLKDANNSASVDYQLTTLSENGTDEIVRAVRDTYKSVGNETLSVDDTGVGDESNVVTQSSPGTNDNILNYISGLLNELQSVLDVDDSGIGDEANVVTQSSPGTNDNLLNYISGILQELQSSLDVSGAEVDVDINNQTQTPLDVDDTGIGDEANVVTQSTPGTNDNLLNYISGVLNELQSSLDVSGAEVDVDINNQTQTPLDVDDTGIGDEANVVTQSSPGTNDNLLNYVSGLLQELQNHVDSSNELSRSQSPNRESATTGQQTTDSYANVTSLTTRVTDSAFAEPTGQDEIQAIVKNAGSSANAADFRLQGRYNDGTNTSDWVDVEEVTSVSDGVTERLGDTDSKAGLFHEYRVQAKASSSGNQTSVDGFIIAK